MKRLYYPKVVIFQQIFGRDNKMEQIQKFILQNQNKVFGAISVIIAVILFIRKSELFTSLLLLVAVMIPLFLIEALFERITRSPLVKQIIQDVLSLCHWIKNDDSGLTLMVAILIGLTFCIGTVYGIGKTFAWW